MVSSCEHVIILSPRNYGAAHHFKATTCLTFFFLTEKETFLDPFVLRDLLPATLGSYYRYAGSLTTPPCSEIVEWIIFRMPVPISYRQVGLRTAKTLPGLFVVFHCFSAL